MECWWAFHPWSRKISDVCPGDGKVDPLSFTVLGFYKLALRCSLVALEVILRDREREASSLAARVSTGIDVLQYIVERLAPAGVLRIHPDDLAIHAARIATFIVKVSSYRRFPLLVILV